jgi:DNA-binding NarL/FixJ family response regulator
MQAPTRVLLADMPAMAREIIRAVLEGHDDIQVVGGPSSEGPLRPLADANRADVVIIGTAGHELPLDCRRLLEERPHTRVIAVAADGSDAFLYELRPHESALRDLSVEDLLAVIRAKRRRAGGVQP